MRSDEPAAARGDDLSLPFVFVHADEPPPADPITSRFAAAAPALLIPNESEPPPER